jgi:hypothetical protein
VRRRHPRRDPQVLPVGNLNFASWAAATSMNPAAARGPTPKWQGTFSTLPLKIKIPPRDPTLGLRPESLSLSGLPARGAAAPPFQVLCDRDNGLFLLPNVEC